MSVKKLIVAVALLSAAATAQAGWVAELPESATVALVFAALGVICLAVRPKRPEPVES
jgi:phosphate/sulfate permease